MAIMEMAQEFKDNNPECIKLLEGYFDTFEEIFKITPEVARYKCLGSTVPGADYPISAVFSDVKGKITLVEIKIQD